MKLIQSCWFTGSLFLISSSIFFTAVTLAQGNLNIQPVSLIKFRGCQWVSSGRHYLRATYEGTPREDVDIFIEKRIYRAVGKLETYSNEIQTRACKLSEPGETPRFETLKLSLGLSDKERELRHHLTDSYHIKIYGNANLLGTKTVAYGSPMIWILDISNIEDLTIEFECRKASKGYCTPLYFFEDTLQ